MKKSELKSGMRVSTANGYRLVVILGTRVGDLLICPEGRIQLSKYSEDLTFDNMQSWNVTAVYDIPDIASDIMNIDCAGNLLWKIQ